LTARSAPEEKHIAVNCTEPGSHTAQRGQVTPGLLSGHHWPANLSALNGQPRCGRWSIARSQQVLPCSNGGRSGLQQIRQRQNSIGGWLVTRHIQRGVHRVKRLLQVGKQ
jgi:hypothetical protein